ncbi:protein KHNYN-like [Phlebotomus argentipes]|uniref:protein KHNYN-like n=1 Tax=Phlebotomus argentipes TaxID=94469 RepID=UPI00289354FF|nr:protein KHNYN-like [Phlebotomus argentipes]
MKRKSSVSHDGSSKRVKFDNSAGPRKRLVVLDGSNIAFFHSNHTYFSVRGLEIAIEEIMRMGHEVVAIVPAFRIKPGKTSDQMLLQSLVNRNLVKLVCLNTFERCYDDSFILNEAKDTNGVVVSNDNYLGEAQSSAEFLEIVENRVIPFMFFKDKFMLPQDPYGENGPTLSSLLNRTS